MKPSTFDIIYLIVALAILITIEVLVKTTVPTPIQYIAAIFLLVIYVAIKDQHLPRL